MNMVNSHINEYGHSLFSHLNDTANRFEIETPMFAFWYNKLLSI